MPTDAPTHMRRCSQWHFYWLRLLLVTAWLSALVGCATLIPEPVLVREPRTHQIPLVVGVYYPEAFRELIYTPPPPPLFSDSMSIGNASVKLFDEALALLFKQVVRVPGPPSTGMFPANVAGVIEPSISTVNLWHPPLGEPISGRLSARASMTYEFSLSGPEGERIAAWKVEGEGVHIVGGGGFESWNTVVRDSFERAMREAGWKLVSGFRDVPDVARWLELHGAK